MALAAETAMADRQAARAGAAERSWSPRQLPGSGPDAGVPTAHWVEVDVHDPLHAVLVAQGNISGAAIGAAVGTFNSSIAANGNHDVIVNLTATSGDMVPTDFYAVHRASDPTGVFTQPIQYATSAGTLFQPDAGSFGADFPVSRWGDYSGATNDPTDPSAFWISNEYGTTPNSWEYATAIAQITMETAIA